MEKKEKGQQVPNLESEPKVGIKITQNGVPTAGDAGTSDGSRIAATSPDHLHSIRVPSVTQSGLSINHFDSFVG